MFLFLIIKDLEDIGIFPPSILSSSWYAKLEEDTISKTSGVRYFDSIIVMHLEFSTLEEIQEFISSHLLDDHTLKNDLQVWATAHNIEFDWKYSETFGEDESYYLTESNGTRLPGLF